MNDEPSSLLRILVRPKAILLAAFAALQVADVITTNHVLAHGGWEANPFEIWAMTHLGPYWWLPKLVVMGVCTLAMTRWPLRYVVPAVALMAVVVTSNAMQ
jgi:Domain of unknown function (DUF5658)